MRARVYRSASRCAAALVGAVVAFVPASSRADDALVLRATLVCPPAGEAGRVRCEVEAKLAGASIAGTSITWADVEITSVPDLIAPLKGRIGPRDATVKDPDVWRFALALVAKRTGAGPVTARVRAVACTANDACHPLVTEARADVRVGPG